MESVSRDGSPVEPYAALPAEPELSTVQKLLGARRRVLDLGAGAGRIADPLARTGRRVVAVDESADMLERITSAETVCSRIEDLRLAERFDAVLLLSHLINTVDPEPLLAAAARHLADDGLLIAQRLAPGRPWHEGSATLGPVAIELSELAVDLPRVAGRTTYRLGDRSWSQDWVLVERDDAELDRLLRQVGLILVTKTTTWITATRIGPPVPPTGSTATLRTRDAADR